MTFTFIFFSFINLIRISISLRVIRSSLLMYTNIFLIMTRIYKVIGLNFRTNRTYLKNCTISQINLINSHFILIAY